MLNGTISPKSYKLLNIAIKDCPPLALPEHKEFLDRLQLMLEADNYKAFGTYISSGDVCYLRIEDGDLTPKQSKAARQCIMVPEEVAMFQGYWFVHIEEDEDDGSERAMNSHVYIYTDD